MSSYTAGHRAEILAADYLKRLGYQIYVLNWRTRYCEIDIVAKKDERLYFVEVKYRQKAAWGNALEYITPKKLRQMSFAAEMWTHTHGWRGEYQLAAVSMDNESIRFTNVNT